MVIKEGYKQTDSGIIPEDWKISSLNDCLELLTDFEANGSFESVADNVNIYDNENYAWYVRATDLEKNSELSNVKFVDESTYNFLKKTSLKGGEVLITKRGEIGKVYFFQMKTKYATVAPNMYLLNLNKSVVPFYIYSFFKAEIGNKLLKEKNASSTLGALYKDDVKSIQIPLPPTLAEQTAIANALSDVDGLITGLEKLIAKKRNIKQGAMQQLLQPKDGWEVKKLGEVSDLITKGTTPTSVGREFQNKGINFIKIESLQKNGEIVKDKVAFIDEFTHNLLQRSQLKSKDILFSIAGALGRVAIVKDEILPANTNQALAIIRLKDGYLVDYIYFYLNNEKIQKYILTISVQGAQANLSLLNISELDIPFPALEEQTRIASVLTDMDAELSALEQKLEKYKRVKLGMMQELLTGKTRLN
jgi:type I restriction enzyme S subunit